jgi:hypothetical protein
MEALHDVVKAGKVRYHGASSVNAWQFAKMQQTLRFGTSVPSRLRCWSRVVAACSSDASGADARPGSFGSTASVGVSPIQCRWNTFLLRGSSSESAYESAPCVVPPVVFELVEQCLCVADGPAPGLAVANGRGHIGEIGVTADRIGRIVQLLFGHAFALDVAQPSGQPSSSSSSVDTYFIAFTLAG